MVLPIGDDRREEVGPPQERTVGRRKAAHDNMVAAAGASMAPIQHEFFGRQTFEVGVLVKSSGD